MLPVDVLNRTQRVGALRESDDTNFLKPSCQSRILNIYFLYTKSIHQHCFRHLLLLSCANSKMSQFHSLLFKFCMCYNGVVFMQLKI